MSVAVILYVSVPVPVPHRMNVASCARADVAETAIMSTAGGIAKRRGMRIGPPDQMHQRYYTADRNGNGLQPLDGTGTADRLTD